LISYVSISGLAKFDLGMGYVLLFFLVAVSFGFFGWMNESRKAILVDKKKQLTLPGSWWTLAIVLLIFTYKYYLGYQDYLDSDFKQTMLAKFLAIFVSGCSVGILAALCLKLASVCMCRL